MFYLCQIFLLKQIYGLPVVLRTHFKLSTETPTLKNKEGMNGITYFFSMEMFIIHSLEFFSKALACGAAFKLHFIRMIHATEGDQKELPNCRSADKKIIIEFIPNIYLFLLAMDSHLKSGNEISKILRSGNFRNCLPSQRDHLGILCTACSASHSLKYKREIPFTLET